MSKTNYIIIKSAQSRQYFIDFSINLFKQRICWKHSQLV